MQIRDLGLGLYGFGFRPAEIGSADFARKPRKGHGSRAHRKTAKMSQVETPSQDETEMPDCISAKLLCARKHFTWRHKIPFHVCDMYMYYVDA